MKMKVRLLASAVIVLVCTSSSAWAQQRVPHKDSAAIGGDVGVFLPKQDGMDPGPVFEGFYEYYVNARDSVRLGVGWADPNREGESSDSVRTVRIGVDVLHNWEGGSIHPFAGAGLGAYFLQPHENGHNAGDSETKFGGALIAGLEFFTSNTFSVKGEAQYHIVLKANGYDPSGLALTIGAKVYF
jgi:Outer membrane protein beta-barrel domain